MFIVYFFPLSSFMNNWQQQAAELAEKYDLKHSPEVHALDLLSELGEVAKELLLATNYGTKSAEFSADLSGELGDLLYSVCMLAVSAEIDLDNAFAETLQKYHKRFAQKGHTGSQS